MVGGGNSAGQAAVFLAQSAQRVHMLVRADGLADTMSRYLIRRIEDNPAIVLHTQTEIVALEGDGHLERVRWRDNRTGDVETQRHPPRVHDDRRRAEHALARAAASRSTATGSSRPVRISRRTIWRRRGWPLDPAALSARNESSRRVRGRRRARRQHQARRLRRRRGIDRRRLRPSGAAPVRRRPRRTAGRLKQDHRA